MSAAVALDLSVATPALAAADKPPQGVRMGAAIKPQTDLGQFERRATQQNQGLVRADFMTAAQPVYVVVGASALRDGALPAEPREFGTGSCGWYVTGKVSLMVEGRPVAVQVGLNLVVVHSKHYNADQREVFKAAAQTVYVAFGEATPGALVASPRQFSTGSVGWYLSDKSTVMVGEAPIETLVPVQVSGNLTVIGSKS